jgi:predicted nucleotidyltransferase
MRHLRKADATPAEVLQVIKKNLSKALGGRLEGVVLYGSCARGEDTAESDIDILVLLDQVSDLGRDLRTCIHAVYPLALEWDRRISVKPVDVTAYRECDCPLFQRVQQEGIAA